MLIKEIIFLLTQLTIFKEFQANSWALVWSSGSVLDQRLLPLCMKIIIYNKLPFTLLLKII